MLAVKWHLDCRLARVLCVNASKIENLKAHEGLICY